MSTAPPILCSLDCQISLALPTDHDGPETRDPATEDARHGARGRQQRHVAAGVGEVGANRVVQRLHPKGGHCEHALLPLVSASLFVPGRRVKNIHCPRVQDDNGG